MKGKGELFFKGLRLPARSLVSVKRIAVKIKDSASRYLSGAEDLAAKRVRLGEKSRVKTFKHRDKRETRHETMKKGTGTIFLLV